MNEALQTIEGWYALHDFRSIDWTVWKSITTEQRDAAIKEYMDLIKQWIDVEQRNEGSTAIYQIVGQKADLMYMQLRESLEELAHLETEFNKIAFAQYTFPVYSYVSIVELSNYVTKKNEQTEVDPKLLARLKPKLPEAKHICFYPMNKRREGKDNWYMLSMSERQKMMQSHGLIGRSYAGKVRQIVTGSIGFDNWEWAVSLFANDALHFKKLIYEMRFDEVSARFAEFGPFYIGNLLDANKTNELLSV